MIQHRSTLDVGPRRPLWHGARIATYASLALSAIAILAGCGRTDSTSPSADKRGVGDGQGQRAVPIFEPRGEIGAGELAAIRDFLSQRIRSELESKGIGAISIGLYDQAGGLWTDGFGVAREGGVLAGRDTVFRVGSVSKLFTDIAVMQRVEKGELDLDAPISDVLPDFVPENPFGRAITLRQLMCHRSGLVREPPIGNYFDDDGTSLADTVRSLNQTTLVHQPGTITKYSNAGIAVVGYVLETLAGVPFEQAVREAVLDVLEMSSSDFQLSDRVSGKLARAQMRTIDGRRFEAPTFQLGMSPAGSLYSTVDDLALFTKALLGRETLLETETFEQMFTPQFTEGDADSGYGLGFRVKVREDEATGERVRSLGHGGAIYGFSTQLEFLPDHGLGVAVAGNLDLSNGTVSRIAHEALEALLVAKKKDETPSAGAGPELIAMLDGFASEVPRPLSEELMATLSGSYQAAAVGGNGAPRLDLRRRGPALILDAGPFMGAVGQLEIEGKTVLMLDGPDGRGPRFTLESEAAGEPSLRVGDTVFKPVASPKPATADPGHGAALGEYGEDHNPLFLYEDQGKLWALIEWLERTPLRQLDASTYAVDSGMYHGERLTLERDFSGTVSRVYLGPIAFDRRSVGTADGETFRITPVRPVADLRTEALAATPPDESGEFLSSDLVELDGLEPSIKLDVRYATTNNFMSTVFYDEPRAFLQRPAAEAVARAHRKLRGLGYGLLIHDAYRPWYVTKMFFDATPEDKKIFVADPSSGSRHNRGCAVDLTLFELATGKPVQMVGGYDEMSDRSFPDYLGGTERQRYLREVLRDAMEAEGFQVYEFEWWHFDYRDWRKYGIQNETFDQL